MIKSNLRWRNCVSACSKRSNWTFSVDYLLEKDIQHRIIQHARKSFFGDTIVLKDEYAEDYLLLKKYTDMFQESF